MDSTVSIHFFKIVKIGRMFSLSPSSQEMFQSPFYNIIHIS